MQSPVNLKKKTLSVILLSYYSKERIRKVYLKLKELFEREKIPFYELLFRTEPGDGFREIGTEGNHSLFCHKSTYMLQT